MTKSRKALLVGIDDYGGGSKDLHWCKKDVQELNELLNYNGDSEKTSNFSCEVLLPVPGVKVDRFRLRDALVALFSGVEGLDVLFYFAGHGATSPFGAELATQDYRPPNSYGVSMNDVVHLANGCKAKQVVIILDCCNSGAIGNIKDYQSALNLSQIGEGVHILAASRRGQAAEESKASGHGLYTEQLIAGLKGAARDLNGDVHVSALHSYAASSFGAHDQTPVIKSSANDDFVLRKCTPKIPISKLRRLVDLFKPTASSTYPLDKEHDDGGVLQTDPKGKVAIYYLLKLYRDNGLLDIPPDTDLYHMIMEGRPLGLSLSGQHYWNRVNTRKI